MVQTRRVEVGLPVVELAVYPAHEQVAALGQRQRDAAAVIGIGPTFENAGHLEPVEGGRHPAGRASEQLADAGRPQGGTPQATRATPMSWDGQNSGL